MPRHSDSHIPVVPSELARLVADSSQPDEMRHRALEALIPLVEESARRTAVGFPEWLRNVLREEAGTIIWLRVGQFDPNLGRFEDWCRVVLHNYGVDLLRKSRNGLVRPAMGGNEASGAIWLATTGACEETSDEVTERCRELRAALDRIAWPSARGVNYFAVLLMQLRLAMIRRLHCDSSDEGASWKETVPDLVEWLLPWHRAEEEASLRPDWPDLSELWSGLRGLTGDGNLRIGVAALCEILDRTLPPWVQLTPDLWHHWVSRSKDGARCRLQDEGLWTRCFSRLLPDR